MRILIIGAAGMLGRKLTASLVSQALGLGFKVNYAQHDLGVMDRDTKKQRGDRP